MVKSGRSVSLPGAVAQGRSSRNICLPRAAGAELVLVWVVPHSVFTAQGHLLLPGSTGSMSFARGMSLGLL